MANIVGSFKLLLNVTQIPSAPFLGGVQIETNVDKRIISGVAAGSLDRTHAGTRTLGAGANEDINLKLLNDGEGDNIDIAELRYLEIENPASSDGALEYKAAAVDGWFGAGVGLTKTVACVVQIRPGTRLILDALSQDGGYTVGATTKFINITNLGTASVQYGVKVLGTST
jgi:hypothetical protein